MDALVFAAGRGTRLRPVTDETPKPLVEIGDRPLLERCLRAVTEAGVDHLVIVVGYRSEEIVDAIGSSFDGVPVSYAVQHDRQGLAHAVCTAFEDAYDVSSVDAAIFASPSDTTTRVSLSDTDPAAYDTPPIPRDVMTVNGDNVFDADCDLSRLVDRHHEPAVDGTVLLDRVGRNEAAATARCTLGSDGRIRSIDATTADCGSASAYLAAGVQTHHGPSLFEACRTIDRSDTGEYELTDAFERLVDGGRRYVGIELDGWHLNVNTPADLETAREKLG